MVSLLWGLGRFKAFIKHSRYKLISSGMINLFFDIDCAYSGKNLPILCNLLHIVVKFYTISRYPVHEHVI